MGLLEFIFGNKKRQVAEYLKKEAVILDVRTKAEWDKGHVDHAKHIPLDELHLRVEEVKALKKPIVTCCRSGVRSAKATNFLRLQHVDAINGGGWSGLQKI
ncbi:rhodanese-like domain-containing protein [Sediminibacter sp. Hel_I_10]|uniref:rhodanese-like domain-containing protein n=1 Tax=Sediminibacter sp. Hel_I_10 TaxID=1392490 RepID=UPI00047A641F|nr:rhodanese-like domain-containing protein [Sediminibacter sp. Hel_I_10]